jgi:hypothetical protein
MPLPARFLLLVLTLALLLMVVAVVVAVTTAEPLQWLCLLKLERKVSRLWFLNRMTS